jgi:hypothetical protein
MDDAVKYKERKVRCYGTGESGPFAEMEDGRRVYGLTGHAPHMLAALEAIHAALNQPVQYSGTHTPETADVLRMDAAIARDMAMAAIKRAKGEL